MLILFPPSIPEQSKTDCIAIVHNKGVYSQGPTALTAYNTEINATPTGTQTQLFIVENDNSATPGLPQSFLQFIVGKKLLRTFMAKKLIGYDGKDAMQQINFGNSDCVVKF